MKWDDLKVFLAVARTGSISGAGRSLGVQHSTVSRRMQQLELDLGVRLLDRGVGGYQLTAAGEDLKGAATRMEREVLAVDGGLLGGDARLQGPIRVTVVNHIAESLLMPVFASFSKKYPEVNLQILGSNTYASLAQREADVAIRVTNAPTETLIGKMLATFSSAVYGSPAYIQSLEEGGADPDWLGTECCGFHREWTREKCPQSKHSLTVDDTALASAALRQGLGLSILPCFLGDADPQLERMSPPDPKYDLKLWVLIHSDLKRTARVRVFREYLADEIQKLGDRLSGN
jgi:DNA-binding transcriptional LysR family regulator